MRPQCLSRPLPRGISPPAAARFAYQTAGLVSRDIRVHVVGADGALRRSERFMAPFANWYPAG